MNLSHMHDANVNHLNLGIELRFLWCFKFYSQKKVCVIISYVCSIFRLYYELETEVLLFVCLRLYIDKNMKLMVFSSILRSYFQFRGFNSNIIVHVNYCLYALRSWRNFFFILHSPESWK